MLFYNLESAGARAIALIFTAQCWWSVAAPLIDLPRCSPAYFPKPLRSAAGVGIGGTTGFVYYLAFGDSLLWKILCAGLLLPSLKYLVVPGLFVVLGFRTTRHIRAVAGDGDLQRHVQPFVLLTADFRPQIAGMISRFFFKLGLAIWRFRSPHLVVNLRDELLSVRLEGAKPSATHSVSSAMRAFLAAHLGYFTAPRSLVAFIDAKALESCDPALDEVARRLASAHLVIPGLGRNLLRIIMSPGRGSLQPLMSGSALRDLRAARVRADEDLMSICHSTPGPCFILALSPPLIIDDLEEAADFELEGYDLLGGSQIRLGSAHALIARRLHSCAFPVTRSDAELPLHLRKRVFDIGKLGLAPLADAYLRFRLSGSDVERFVVLLECFEALFKYSTIALLRNGSGDDVEEAQSLRGRKPPAMGTWAEILSKLADSSRYQDNPHLARIAEVWGDKSPCPIGLALVKQVRELGIGGSLEVPATNVGWLRWLTAIRNATRGHGGLKERTSGVLWHGLHYMFLQLVDDLRDLTIDAEIVAVLERDLNSEVSLRGWRRGPYRTSTLSLSPVELERHISQPKLRLGPSQIPLTPYTILKGNACWTWNGRKKSRLWADYVDYGSGRVARLEIPAQ